MTDQQIEKENQMTQEMKIGEEYVCLNNSGMVLLEVGDHVIVTGYGGGQPYRLGILTGNHSGEYCWTFGDGFEFVREHPDAKTIVAPFEEQYSAWRESFEREYEEELRGATNAFDRVYGTGALDELKDAAHFMADLLRDKKAFSVRNKLMNAEGTVREFENSLTVDERVAWDTCCKLVDSQRGGGFSGAVFGGFVCEVYNILHSEVYPDQL